MFVLLCKKKKNLSDSNFCCCFFFGTKTYFPSSLHYKNTLKTDLRYLSLRLLLFFYVNSDGFVRSVVHRNDKKERKLLKTVSHKSHWKIQFSNLFRYNTHGFLSYLPETKKKRKKNRKKTDPLQCDENMKCIADNKR